MADGKGDVEGKAGLAGGASHHGPTSDLSDRIEKPEFQATLEVDGSRAAATVGFLASYLSITS